MLVKIKEAMMTNIDKTTRFVLIWIAIMLTIIALKEICPVPLLMAQEENPQVPKLKLKEPIEVIIREPISVKISDWNAYPSQPLKVKIDDPWPARVEIKDEIKVKGELKLQN